mmetsp:Transcript_96808/g.230364  ORF Transcript_96808/g.230364 Transcript_96808/m.230364 type:complete len:444 (+) Transcript_96808:79-1410(+)|eukprot:CAMPEP_0181439446 /NCGR_PEP_ID=MMETSP1110-20121109/22431_1 /TAXON_ID=174948 /ORGANISM="Symbiodinium sp., Strain CCMP421" /LENGTH=443 /DNA_ID=CAMNT_0023563169 /DNA_START=80 /DNA_END=1411 /DNA_ORIENTATION=-
MECLTEDPTDDCDMAQLVGYLAGLLCGVFICSCVLSGCLFYCRWKMRTPDVGAITMRTSEGRTQDVKFQIWKAKPGASASEQDQPKVGKTTSLRSSTSSKSQGKTVVTWNVDARQTAGRSFMSTGKVKMTANAPEKEKLRKQATQMTNNPNLVAQGTLRSISSFPTMPTGSGSPSPREPEKAVEETAEKAPSRWKERAKSLAKSLTGLSMSVRQEAYRVKENVDYFSVSNGMWTPAVIISRGKFDEDGIPVYDIRVHGSRQTRSLVPMTLLRPELLPREPISFYSNTTCAWEHGEIEGIVGAHMLGYSVLLPKEQTQTMPARLRRRFLAKDPQLVYQGPLQGWIEATLLEDAEELSDDVPGRRDEQKAPKAGTKEQTDDAKAVKKSASSLPKLPEKRTEVDSPEVMLKLRLKTSDPENGAEVVEVPSGRVRFSSVGETDRSSQ